MSQLNPPGFLYRNALIYMGWLLSKTDYAVTERRNEGLDVPPEFLPHISPLGWAHILLTGEYLWPKEPKA
ncbi:TPA: hypothetical protein MIC22_29640 [Klebsiella pneumoniae]|nr:hypothetical protein [Klebsiella pneumoniae]